jgi:GTP-binding protein Era
LLGERPNAEVRAAWAEVDVIEFCLPADETIGPGDRFIAKELAEVSGTPKVAIVTKTDRRATGCSSSCRRRKPRQPDGHRWARWLISAVAGEQVDLLASAGRDAARVTTALSGR